MTTDRARRPWLRRLQPLFMVAILVAVASTLPFEDELRLAAVGDESERTLEGTYDGDWKGDAVTFVAHEGGAVHALARDADGAWRTVGDAMDGNTVEGRAADVRPSMQRVFRGVEPAGLALAFAGFFAALFFGITRWWRLLRVVGCDVRWRDAFRLTYLGMFFNLVVPGLTGGDVVKAVLAARENPGKRADALVSVAVDRLIGLLALAALAMVVILVLGGEFAALRLPLAAALAALVVGGAVYVNRTLRRLLRFDALLARVPFGARLKQLDDALLVYTGRPAELALAFALSLGNHFANIAAVMALGVAFGVPLAALGWWEYVAIVPVASMVSALPIAPGGWGVGEAAYQFLFELVGASGALGVAVSVAFRLCQLAIGLLGGLYLLGATQRAELRSVDLARAAPAPAPTHTA